MDRGGNTILALDKESLRCILVLLVTAYSSCGSEPRTQPWVEALPGVPNSALLISGATLDQNGAPRPGLDIIVTALATEAPGRLPRTTVGDCTGVMAAAERVKTATDGTFALRLEGSSRFIIPACLDVEVMSPDGDAWARKSGIPVRFSTRLEEESRAQFVFVIQD